MILEMVKAYLLANVIGFLIALLLSLIVVAIVAIAAKCSKRRY